MWDPISLFFCAYILNIGMPEARLKVRDIIEQKEKNIICESVSIRKGI